jgi:uncharacterized membrane protein YecN with MAPEG domain
VSEAIRVTFFYVALNALLMFALALNVGLRRGAQNQLQPGDMGDVLLTRAIRAHANFAEYSAIVLLLLLGMAVLGAEPFWIHIFGGVFTFGRVLHVFGMMRDKHPNAVRFIGNLVTGLALLVGAGACLWLSTPWM